MSVPVVDFSPYSLPKSQGVRDQINGLSAEQFDGLSAEQFDDLSAEQFHGLSAELHAAFTNIGFVFLKNTGITQEEVDQVQDLALRFFLQPEDVKQAFSRGSFATSPNHGWVSLEVERLNPRRPGDLKEAFNTSCLSSDTEWPNGSLSRFQDSQTLFFLRCKDLSLRVLKLMAHSLDLDPDLFLSAHQLVGTSENGTTLRSLYYPPVDSEKIKQDQLRCGEHSDYGSITLLFQSSEGLQVRSRSGDFINVPVIPGAVLINIADLMQRWTNDEFVSVLHRVLLPPAGDSSTRQSLAFFLQPDDEVLITCCNGSNKYPPVRSKTYLMQRLAESYATERI